MTTAPHIRIGAMRSYADLQVKSTLEDAGGGKAVTWSTERKIFCRIRPLSGSQRLEGMRRESKVTHDIYTNYAPDVDPDVVTKKRIRLDTSVYNIAAAWMPEETPEFVHMIAERGVAT
jgi:SPP1 family predicted phage head-tail adaptor